MLMILLDAVVIVAIVYIVNQGEQMDFGPAALCGLGISLGSLACALLLGPAIGIFALVPMLAVAIALIWMVAKIPLQQATIAGVIFFVYKMGVSFALDAVLNRGVA
jgi:hypothetical protein